jgi:molybdopterin synthase sulfur carrier subunit
MSRRSSRDVRIQEGGELMPVQVHLTSVIQKSVDGNRELAAEASTVTELIEHIEARYPGFRAQLVDEQGNLHRFVNIYLNDEDIRYLDGADTALADGDSVSILPALAGG